jgi:hypothetical protein
MPLIPQQEWGDFAPPEETANMVSLKEYAAQDEQLKKPDADFDVVISAAMEKENIVSSYQAKFENLPSKDTPEEQDAFISGKFNTIDGVPEEHKNNPIYMKEYYKYGTSQRKIDWVADNIYRQEENNRILDENVVSGMAASLIATLLSPEQLPTFIIPAGLMLKTGGTLARLSLTKAVAYEATVGGASAIAAEGLLHPTQVTRTKKESMYAVGASVLFSGMLTGVIGMATRDASKVLHNVDKDMVDIDSNPAITSVGAKEADIDLPSELENAAVKRVDEQIAAGDIKIENRDVALQNERKMLSDTLSQVKNPKAMRLLGYAHPSVRIATSKISSARTLGEQLVSDSLTRMRHIYGESLGDAIEVTIDQFKNQNSTKIQNILEEQYSRYAQEAKKVKGKTLSYSEFSGMVGKANREEDLSDIKEVASAAKQLRNEVSKPIEKRLVEQDLIDSYYTGFDALKREDFEDLIPEEKLDELFSGDTPIDGINERLPTEVMDELQRMGKLNKEAKIPKGDKSYFHRKWDQAAIENNPQDFLKTIRESLREVSIEGMTKKETILESKINTAREKISARKTDPKWDEAKPRSRSQRLKEKEDKKIAVKKASDELKASRQSYDKSVRDKNSVTAVREKARTRMHRAQKNFVAAQRSNPIPLEQKILEMEDDLAAMRIEHVRYQEKQLDADLNIAAREIKTAVLGGKLQAGYRLKSFTSGPLKDRTFIPESAKVDKYLDNNADNVWNDYVEQIAPQMHMKERFGSSDLLDELEKIASDYDDAIDAATSKNARKLEIEKKQTLRDIQAMIDSIHGTYKMPDAPDSFLSKAAQRLREFNFITLLGQMTTSAIPDLGSIILRHGLRGSIKGLTKVATMSKGMKLSMRQQRVWGAAIDLTNNITVQKRAMLDNRYALESRTDRVMQKATSTFSKLTGMTHWNAALKQFTGFIYANDIITDAFRLASGKLDGNKVTRYARGGLSKNDMTAIAKSMDAQEITKMDGVFIPNPDEWADQALAQRFKSALLKEIDNTIVTPSIGDLPLMSRGEIGRLAFQFKSFALSANQKIVLANIDDFSAQKVIGMLSMVALGGVSQVVRDATKGKETKLKTKKDIASFLDNAIDRSGLLAYWGDVNGMIEKTTQGRFGIIPKFADKPLDRFASRNVLGSILGPSAGRVSDITQITGAISAGDWRESDARAARRMIGFNNLFWTHRIFNKLEEAAGGKQYGTFGQEK